MEGGWLDLLRTQGLGVFRAQKRRCVHTVNSGGEFAYAPMCKVLVWACRCVDRTCMCVQMAQVCGAGLHVEMFTVCAGCYWV